MVECRVTGEILSLTLREISNALQQSLTGIRMKSDDEMFIRNDEFDLEIYEYRQSSDANSYLVGGFVQGDLDDVEVKLRSIATLLATNGIKYNFEFYLEGHKNNDPTEERVIKHPEF